MGLGLTRISICSATADKTGDDSLDGVVKIRRLINQRGPSFCNLGNFPFLRSDLSFSITTAAHYYSGTGYLPATFKRVVAAYIVENDRHYDLVEVGIKEAYEWPNPDDNSGRPDEFCITRNESGYYQIKFNRIPDTTYTVYLEIELQWTDLTADTSESLIAKDYYDYFVHYVAIARFVQQGDTEGYLLAKKEWFDPSHPKDGLLTTMLSGLSGPLKQKSVKMNMEKAGVAPQYRDPDYNNG